MASNQTQGASDKIGPELGLDDLVLRLKAQSRDTTLPPAFVNAQRHHTTLRDVAAQWGLQERSGEQSPRRSKLLGSTDGDYLLGEVVFDEDERVVITERANENPAAIRDTAADLGQGSEDHEPFWLEACRRVARTGRSERLERRAGPEGRWYDIDVFRPEATDAAGRRVIVLFHDKTDRHASELPLRDLFDTLSLGTLMARSLDGTVEFWSQGCERLYGWSASEAVGRNVHDLLHTVFPESQRDVQAALERGGAWTGDLRQTDRDGREVMVLAHSALRRDAEGRPVAVVESHLDVTAQRWAEAATRESGDRAAALEMLTRSLHALGSPGEIAGRAMRFLRGSLGADRCAWLEVEAEQDHFSFAGVSAAEGVRGIEGRYPISAFGARALRKIRSGQPLITSDAMLDPSAGDDRDARFSTGLGALLVMPVQRGGRFVAGTSVQFASSRRWTTEDIDLVREVTHCCWEATERARAEQALEESRERLRQLQMEMSHTARLSVAGEMAAALAHELNQPLAAVVNYLGAARIMLASAAAYEPGQVAEARDVMGMAAEQALRAGQIVRRLRDFVAKGRNEMRPEDLHRLVEEAAKLALTGEAERNIRSELLVDPDLPAVLADPIQIQQVLVNLIRNSVEAMEDGAAVGGMPHPRKIIVSAALEGSGMVRVTVADTGPGLAPEVSEHLFKPFMTTKPQGMGMGLSICRSIVEAHGGRFWAESTLPVGTAFHFTVPIAPPLPSASDLR